MKLIRNLVCVALIFSRTAWAQSPVALAINTHSHGYSIPADFVGLSFETGALQYNSPGVHGYLFDSTNTQLLTLFRNLGIKTLRVGGTSVDRNTQEYIPAKKDIDALFRFAKAADVKVIYSLRLLNGDPSRDATEAKYVWDNFQKYVSYFAIGNEPNLYKGEDAEITDDASFYTKWKKFFVAINHAIPAAKFGGPDTGTGGTDWASYFAKQETGSKAVTCIFSHYYVGGFPKSNAGKLIDGMLSPAWDKTKYPAYYDKLGATALSFGFSYRLTELNNYVASFPGIAGGNNSYATALFALDCMHWWTAHSCAGVNLHTYLGKYNGTICVDSKGNYQIYPIGYGIKAFDLGGQGTVDPVAISNSDSLNLTAYAVADTNNNLFVTVINKEHGTDARDALVTITPDEFSSGSAEAMFLVAPHGDTGTTTGMTLGGASITNDIPWAGKWIALKPNKKDCVVTVPAASAAVVKILAH